MKFFYFVFMVITFSTFSNSYQMIEDFKDNSKEWYTASEADKKIFIENGNYIIQNLDAKKSLSLADNFNYNNSYLYISELIFKYSGEKNSLFGVYLELKNKDKFYLFISPDKKVGFGYEHEGDFKVLQELEDFPYLSADYNSLVLVKQNNMFTFLLNDIYLENNWTINQEEITKLGFYIEDLSTLFIDKYTIYSEL